MRAVVSLACSSVVTLSMVLCGCGAPAEINLPDDNSLQLSRTCDVRVYSIRGLWDIYSLGLNDLTEKLRAEGVWAAARSDTDWQHLADDIAAQLAAEPKLGPIVLTGHSYGADDAIRAAKSLENSGHSVALLVLIDATAPPAVPANVDHVIHYYLPNPLGDDQPGLYPGNPVSAEAGNAHTLIENVIFSAENFGKEIGAVDHFNLEENDVLHRLIIAHAKDLCSAKQE